MERVAVDVGTGRYQHWSRLVGTSPSEMTIALSNSILQPISSLSLQCASFNMSSYKPISLDRNPSHSALSYLHSLHAHAPSQHGTSKFSRSCCGQTCLRTSQDPKSGKRRPFFSAISPTLSSLGQSVPGHFSEKSPSFPGWKHPRFCLPK